MSPSPSFQPGGLASRFRVLASFRLRSAAHVLKYAPLRFSPKPRQKPELGWRAVRKVVPMAMKPISWSQRLLLGALSLSTALGCGPQFDPGNEIKTLRVLGVKKDKPYAQPGDDVNLQLLWHDPKGRDGIERVFVG